MATRQAEQAGSALYIAAAAEKAVIAAGLVDRATALELQWLTPEDFYHEREQRAWAGIQEVVASGATPDPILVGACMRDAGEAAPITYLTELAERLPDAANARHYARKVREAATRRRLASLGMILSSSAKTERDVRQVVEHATAQLMALADWDTRPDAGEAHAIAERVVNDAWRRKKEKGNAIQGFRWGWRNVDEKVQPIRAGRLYTLAALTSVGKTTFALQLASNVTNQGGSVMYVPLEQGVEEVVCKIIAQRARVSANQFEDWTLSDADAIAAVAEIDRLSTERFLLDGYRGMSVPTLKLRAEQRKRQKGLDLIIVDYLQLMLTAGKSDNRANEVAALARGLKIIAGELGVAVMMLSQLSRGFEERKDKDRDAEPVLRDLSESSEIEKSSDAVIFLDRVTHARISESPEIERRTKVIVAKQRHGMTGRTYLDFSGAHSRFDDLDTWARPAGRDLQAKED